MPSARLGRRVQPGDASVRAAFCPVPGSQALLTGRGRSGTSFFSLLGAPFPGCLIAFRGHPSGQISRRFGNSAQGDGVDGIVSWNHEPELAVAHYDVAAFAGNPVAELFKYPDGITRAYAGKPRHIRRSLQPACRVRSPLRAAHPLPPLPARAGWLREC